MIRRIIIFGILTRLSFGESSNCMQEIATPFGQITSPNFPYVYPSKSYCVWLFTTTPGHKIKLEFIDFDLEENEICAHDFVAIYDGLNMESRMVGKFCGSVIPPPILSSGNTLYMVFKTDDYVEEKGFKATHATEGNCTYQIMTSNQIGEITSPSLSANYSNLEYCAWLFTTIPGRTIRLDFNRFHLQSESVCDQNWISIFDGDNDKAPVLGKFCGNELPPSLHSSDNRIYMVFRFSNILQEQEFTATHKAEGNCTHQVTSTTTDISSPNYPNNYLNLENCEWIFSTTPGLVIKLDFEKFDLQPDNQCNFDWVAIYDGDSTESTMIGKFCGSEIPPPIISSTSKLYMVFKSDNSVGGQGFKAKYITGDCLYNIRDPFGDLKTPNFSSTSPSMKDCIWNFIVTPGLSIKLDFEESQLEDDDCDNHQVTIYDGYRKYAEKLGTFCGMNIPHTILSSGNKMYMELHSDNPLEISGFKATYTTGNCFHRITDAIGKITTPNFPDAYPNAKECIWQLTTYHGYIIKLIFNEFGVEESDQCMNDWVAIYDGHSTKSPILGIFCGSEVPNPILSSGNRLQLVFKSDNSTQRKGFNAAYKTVNCMYQITNPFGEIYSSNYPDFYSYYSFCTWLFTAVPGHKIKLVFNDFELEGNQWCAYDSVAVYDGDSTKSTSLGKFCGEEIPHPIQSSHNKMFVVFMTDGSTQKKGFRATYSTGSQDINCETSTTD